MDCGTVAQAEHGDVAKEVQPAQYANCAHVVVQIAGVCEQSTAGAGGGAPPVLQAQADVQTPVQAAWVVVQEHVWEDVS